MSRDRAFLYAEGNEPLDNQYEKIPVLIRYARKSKRPICVCHRKNKACDREGCSKENVYRDKLDGWHDVMKNREGPQ